MARFIKLTNVHDGDPICVNADRIAQFRHNKGYEPKPDDPPIFEARPACTDIFLIDSEGYPLKVRETPDEIMNLLNA